MLRTSQESFLYLETLKPILFGFSLRFGFERYSLSKGTITIHLTNEKRENRRNKYEGKCGLNWIRNKEPSYYTMFHRPRK